jgi:small-conductance mechanosensitive channel
MLAPVDLSYFETVFSTSRGYIELAVEAACLGAAWLLDRWLRARARERQAADGKGHGRLASGFARLIFPLLALAFLFVARFGLKRFGITPFLTDIAIPLLIAMALIRISVYAMRQLFSRQAWLKSSERAISLTIWGVVALHFLGVLPELADALDDVKIPLGAHSTSLLEVGKGLLAVVLTLAVTMWVSGSLEQRVLSATQIDTNTRAVLAKFLRAVLLVVGVLVALQSIGFDLTLLSVFGGALGVGVGLGLQKLAANYFAGFTILLDRSIRLGDMITVDDRTGVVSRVTSRYVVLQSLDGIEAIVPNENLITKTVLNHSYSKRDVRGSIGIQIAYDSDVDLALKLMEDAAAAEPRVMHSTSRAPGAFLVNFGDNGINLELGYWIQDPESGQLALKSALNRRIYQTFKENGIVIPYPRRDVRVLPPGTVDAPAALNGPTPSPIAD